MQNENKVTDAIDLREFASQFAAGVAVISTVNRSHIPVGVTMTAVLSLSLEPPLFLISLDNNSNTLSAVRESGHFCINFLSDRQAGISKTFASKDQEKFKDVDFSVGVTGSPCITGAVAHGECEVQDQYPAGDHTIIIGRVVRTGVFGGKPLVYHSGKYASLAEFGTAA